MTAAHSGAKFPRFFRIGGRDTDIMATSCSGAQSIAALAVQKRYRSVRTFGGG